ncbi:MAG: Ig-like domain-containing protein [Pseudomonadota bacterium]
MRNRLKDRISAALFAVLVATAPSGAIALELSPGNILTTSETFAFSIEINEFSDTGSEIGASELLDAVEGEDLQGLVSGPNGLVYAMVTKLPDDARLVSLGPSGAVFASFPLRSALGGNVSLGKVVYDGGDKIFVGGRLGVDELDLSSFNIRSVYDLGRVFDLAVLPSGNLLVAERNSIWEVDPADGRRIQRFVVRDPNDLTGIAGFSTADFTILGIEYSEALNRVYVSADTGPASLLVFDFATGDLVLTENFAGADDLYLDADGNLLIASASVAPWVVNPNDLTIVGRLDGGPSRFITRYEPPTVLPAIAFPDVVSGVVAAVPIAIDIGLNDLRFSDPVSVSIVSGPANGAARVLGSPGPLDTIQVEYTSVAGFNGEDSLIYQISDGVSTAMAPVRVNVIRAAAFDDVFEAALQIRFEFDVLANDLGFIDPVTVTVAGSNRSSTINVINSPGPRDAVRIQFTGRCCTQFPYTESFTYTVSDGLTTDTAAVEVNVAGFIAQDDTADTNVDTPVEIPIAANDFGFDFGANVSLFTTPGNGTVALDSPNFFGQSEFAIRYTPAPGFVGIDTFQYVVQDDDSIDIAAVTVNVRTDVDIDTIPDALDNCVEIANRSQLDTDSDGFGNICDADLNNDGFVNFVDLSLFRGRFGSADPDADLNGDSLVNFSDLGILRSLFGRPPGPSNAVP